MVFQMWSEFNGEPFQLAKLKLSSMFFAFVKLNDLFEDWMHDTSLSTQDKFSWTKVVDCTIWKT